jgi:signal transduction histidine kinase
MTNSGKRLLDVVNDILDLSRLDSGKAVVTDEVFEVGPAVEACIRIAHAWEEEHERPLAFSGETGTVLRADSSMFKKMVVNLLSNAMKFSDPGSEVSVHVTLAADGGLRLSVTDNGIGIAEKDIERLSVPFFQVDGSLARVKEGTGLGLTIVNGYIALHDGHMEVESAPDEGTTFTLVFPADRVQLADGEQAQSGHG